MQNSTRHDSSVAVYFDGEIYCLAAERVDRIKHSLDFRPAATYLARTLGLADELAPQIDSLPEYDQFQSVHHHEAHAASAFFGSPFDSAAVVVADGMGPYRNGQHMSTSIWKGTEGTLELIDAVVEPYPCFTSLGHFYSAVTWYLGFDFFEAAHTMSIAALGDPGAKDVSGLLSLSSDDRFFTTDPQFIEYATRLRFPNFLGTDFHSAALVDLENRYRPVLGPARRPGDPLEQTHFDVAAAAQAALEGVLLRLFKTAHDRTGLESLCYAGGVALNCVANTRVLRQAPFSEVFIQPACDDTGQSLGKLLLLLRSAAPGRERQPGLGPYLGAPLTEAVLQAALSASSDRITAVRASSEDALAQQIGAAVAQGQVVAWCQGRSEFGPRALGHRSVLADPRQASSIENVSTRFKRREWYRPFAPSILQEKLDEYIEPGEYCDAFMLGAPRVREAARETIPAVVHVDGTARVQVVSPQACRRFRKVLLAFYERTGVPALLNTSFNAPGDPIVETPEDALNAFLESTLDLMVLDLWIVTRRSGA